MCTICSAFRPYNDSCDYDQIDARALSGVGATGSAATAIEADLSTMATYLSDGYWADAGSVRHAFDTSASTNITVNITGLDSDGQQLARWAFEAWEAVANVHFVETTGTAQITLDDAMAGAMSGASILGDVTQAATVNVGRGWLDQNGTDLGSYGFQTYLHEVGHALGLGHMGFYDGNARYGHSNQYTNDSWQMSVMSYFNQVENTAIQATRAEAVTTMLADIMAIQDLYGAADGQSLTAGGTTYGVGHSLGNSWLGQLFDAMNGVPGSGGVYDGGPVAMTFWDAGGYDRIDFSNDSANQKVNLNSEGISNVYGSTGNMLIASGTMIEEFRAGSGHDVVTGNNGKNVLIGNGGNDQLNGLGGRDRLVGGDGTDQLNGGKGLDTLIGGAGADKLIGGGGMDTADYRSAGSGLTVDLIKRGSNTGDAAGDSYVSIESLRGSHFDDTLNGNGRANTIMGEKGGDRIDGRGGNDRLEGGKGGDVLSGGAGNDRLNGGIGQDRLDGGAGNDTMTGGNGRDVFIFKAGADVITDFDGDRLRLDDALWGGKMNKAGILSHASVQGNDTVFDFGGGNTLTLEDYTDINGLSSLLSVF